MISPLSGLERAQHPISQMTLSCYWQAFRYFPGCLDDVLFVSARPNLQSQTILSLCLPVMVLSKQHCRWLPTFLVEDLPP